MGPEIEATAYWLGWINLIKLVAFFIVAVGVVLEFGAELIGKPLERKIEAARELQIAELNNETVRLQKSVAWRKIEDDQAAKITSALSGTKATGHLLILNRNDPEQAQFLFKIVTLCNRIGLNCRVHFVDPARPYPFSFPPAGVMSFVFDDAGDADKLFVQAFRNAGVADKVLGLLPASQLFPPSVRAGIVIAAKPDALEAFPWSTQSPEP